MKEDFWTRGIEEIIDEKSLVEKLKGNKKLIIKHGVDPTRPDIHLGHSVVLLRLKELQDLGHKIVFLIGDYTTKIGDPSGKSKTRPMLSDKEIAVNAKTYMDQVGKILDLKKTEIRYNSEWYKKLDFNDILQLAAKFTVAQILERDDFEKRLKMGSDVGIHEMLYPIMQAYDSIMLEADIEFGGTDQKFNMLAGRSLQKKFGQNPQDIVMMRLLVGPDGKNKMSKSLDNYIGISESANSQFGKIMSIPDSLIEEYFNLCTTLSDSEIKKLVDQMESGTNPRDIKEKLGLEIVTMYHGKAAAEKAANEFRNVFANKELPTNIPKVKISGNYELPVLMLELRSCDSNSEARRLIVQGAVKVDGVKIIDPKSEISTYKGMIVQIGKKKYYEIN